MIPKQTKLRQLTQENRQFAFSVAAQFATASDPAAARKFNGVAYSGEVIQSHWYWGNVIFDVSSIELPSKNIAALVDHDPGLRAGFIEEFSVAGKALNVRGTLMTNETGLQVASESDQGFPWQMSVRIDPGSVEEIQPGFKAAVNGVEHTGPLTIFRNSTISEVSFCAVGWDSNTSAAAMSRSGSPKPFSKEENDMTLQELQDRVAELEADKTSLTASNVALTQERDAALVQVTQFSAEARTSAIQNLFSAIKREYKADDPDVKAFAALPKEAFESTANLLKSQAARMNPALFSHVAGGASGATGADPTPAPKNRLIDDAKSRAAQFSKAR